MTSVTKPLRGRRPTKRLDLTDIKEALADGKQWTALGVVVAGDGGLPHWEIVDGADIHVEVELQPTRERVFARLAAGMWIVPALGEEVAVVIPAGDVTFMPTIVCILANTIPTSQGPTPERIAIRRAEVVIHDGDGGAAALPTTATLADLRDKILSWTPAAGDGGLALKAALATLFGADPVTGSPLAGDFTWPTTTTVLKAK